MFGKTVRVILTGVVVLLLAVVVGSVVFAQEAVGGTGPAAVLSPGEWRSIMPGEKHWYKFTYDYDREFVDPIGIYLFGEPDNGAMFTVRTPEQVEEWIMDGENDWVGCCAVNDYVRGDRSWSGYFVNSGDYFVVVEPMGIHDEVAYYKLEIDGDNVSLPAMMTAMEPAVNEAVVESVMAEPATMAVADSEPMLPEPMLSERPIMGSGPDDAFTVDGAWHKLELGDRHWYAFNFDYVEDMKDETIDISMRVEPDTGALFTVRTPEQAQTWRDEGEHPFMGCCAANEFAPGDVSWAGALPETGTYYLVVEHSRIHPSDTVYHALDIEGKNVDLTLPAPVMIPAAAPQAAAPLAMASATEAELLPGSGPDNTLTFDGGWRELTTGGEHWYSFDFDYDEDIDKPIQIGMFVEPEDSAIFTIRTPENITLWRDEGEVEFVGCCSASEVGLGDVSWAGSFADSGTYFVVVEHDDATAEPANYQLLIEGR